MSSFCSTFNQKTVDYVCGFMLKPAHAGTLGLFIEKNRPDFQKGKWNGIGGKIEVGERPIEAMVREFYEETGAITTGEDWTQTVILMTDSYTVYYYRAFVDEWPQGIHQTTDEALGYFLTDSILGGSVPVLDNMKWILPLSMSKNVVFPVVAQWQR